MGLLLSGNTQAYTEQLAIYLRNHQTEQAYQWLLSHQPTQANNPQYNDWLAQLAMQTGDYPQAINALERLIIQKPHHLGARIDLTLAYLKTGDRHQARQEFFQLQQLTRRLSDLPSPAVDAIQAIEQALTESGRRQLSGQLSVSAGIDTNINQGSSNSLLQLDLDGQTSVEIDLDPRSLAQQDSYLDYRLQLVNREPQPQCSTRQWCHSLMLDLSTRQHNSQSAYNQYQALLAATWQRNQRQLRRRLITYLQYARLTEADTLSTFAAEFSQRYRLGQGWAGFALSGNYRHEDGSRLPDTYQGTLSLLGEHDNGWQANWTLGYHNQPERYSGDSYSSSLTIGYKKNWHDWYLQPQLGLSWERDTQPYNEVFFGETHRQDYKAALQINLSRLIDSDWLINVRLGYSKNHSNISLFERDRAEASLSLSYLW